MRTQRLASPARCAPRTATDTDAAAGATRHAPTGNGPPEPKRARGRATRARLLDAGVKSFSRKGFHATRVDDIVKRAKTCHGTFYLYFASKDDLFEQLVTDVAAEFRELTDALPVIRDRRRRPRRPSRCGWARSSTSTATTAR